MNLVIQSFGRENEYKRGILTILSFYAHLSVPVANTKVILFTDKPAYFEQYLNGLPIQYVLLTEEKIKRMRGKIDFLHRMKIAVIEEAFNLGEDDILYADSDTFFVEDPCPLMLQLTSSKSFMHEWEYQFEFLRDWKLPSGQSFRDFLNLIESQNFLLANGKTTKITPQHSSWNAGVMMLHKTHIKFIEDVYTLTDQFYPISKNHASEQYAFSIMLQEHTKLSACDSVIYHYWYRVKKQIVDQFLNRYITNSWSESTIEDKLADVKSWCNMLPAYFDKHEWMIQDHAIQAFNENKFSEGYKWAAKAIIQKPLSSGPFIKDTLYHIKRHVTKSK